MSKLKNWLLANNFTLESYNYYNLYSIKINSYKNEEEEVSVYLNVGLFNNKHIDIFVSKVMTDDDSNNEITLFETDNEDEVDRYWILDTIKFLKK